MAGAPVTYTTAFSWLKRTESLAKVEHLPGGGWHAFRRLWVTERRIAPRNGVSSTLASRFLSDESAIEKGRT